MATKGPDEEAAPSETQAAFITETVNENVDAPTIFIDAVQGAMVSTSVTKICLIEHLIPFGQSGLKGRYVLNLAFPTDQLRSIGEALVRLADSYEK